MADVMTAISLREAAKQLRRQAEVNFGDPGGQVSALARLLDGDAKGGLLGQHTEHRGDCTNCHEPQLDSDCYWLPYPCPTLTLVAAYVSAVLGTTVEA